ncbi:MAG: hypothetical protein ACJAV1_004007, partial [Paraglaciecola sp.]
HPLSHKRGQLGRARIIQMLRENARLNFELSVKK